MKCEGGCIFNQAFYVTAYQPAWPWRRGPACTSHFPQLCSIWLLCERRRDYTDALHKREKKTALQRVRFSHFFLRTRDCQNRCRIGRRVPG